MNRKVRWTPLALQDLLEIKEYIERDKPTAAKLQAEKIRKSTEKLKRFPLVGRELETIPTVRKIVSGNYRIFYRLGRSQVEILRIYHAKRDIT